MKRTVRKVGTFQIGAYGVYPPGNHRGDELVTLWAVEPDHTQHMQACHPALPTGRYLYPSRRAAEEAARKMGPIS